jgi:hypothetical protein
MVIIGSSINAYSINGYYLVLLLMAIGGYFINDYWSPKTKCHLDVGLMERHKVYYKGEGGGFPQIWGVVNLLSQSLPMSCLNTNNTQTM